jgi:hypothetical protein
MTVCESLEEGKNVFKGCMSKYVKGVYDKEGITMYNFDDGEGQVIETFEMVKKVEDDYEYMSMENWEIDWTENEDTYEVFMQKDLMSEIWQDETGYWIICKIVDVKTSIKVVVTEDTHAIKVGEVNDLMDSDESEDDVNEDVNPILKKFAGLGYGDTYDEICTYLLKKNGLNRRMINKFVDQQV